MHAGGRLPQGSYEADVRPAQPAPAMLEVPIESFAVPKSEPQEPVATDANAMVAVQGSEQVHAGATEVLPDAPAAAVVEPAQGHISMSEALSNDGGNIIATLSEEQEQPQQQEEEEEGFVVVEEWAEELCELIQMGLCDDNSKEQCHSLLTQSSGDVKIVAKALIAQERLLRKERQAREAALVAALCDLGFEEEAVQAVLGQTGWEFKAAVKCLVARERLGEVPMS